METTVQTDRTIPNNKLIILRKNKKKRHTKHIRATEMLSESS